VTDIEIIDAALEVVEKFRVGKEGEFNTPYMDNTCSGLIVVREELRRLEV
jgi:hypothetical protein